MKSKPEFDTRFEKMLAEFEMSPLPPEWKRELIANAVLEAEHQRGSKMPTVLQMAVATLAVCWVAIAALQLTTPSPKDFSETVNKEPIRISSEELPVVAAHFARLKSTEVNF